MADRKPCSQCGAEVLISILAGNSGICLRCANPNKRSGSPPEPIGEPFWELCPENGSDLSREVLTSDLFWESSNDYAPLGNDTGSDTIDFFRSWRMYNSGANCMMFVQALLSQWEVYVGDWDQSEVTQDEIQSDHYNLLTRDDVIVAVVFSEIIIDGAVSNETGLKALAAIERQKLPSVLTFRDWTSTDERLRTLQLMKEALLKAMETSSR